MLLLNTSNITSLARRGCHHLLDFIILNEPLMFNTSTRLRFLMYHTSTALLIINIIIVIRITIVLLFQVPKYTWFLADLYCTPVVSTYLCLTFLYLPRRLILPSLLYTSQWSYLLLVLKYFFLNL